MVNEVQYKKLCELAQKMAKGTSIHFIDVVHDALMVSENPTALELRHIFYAEKRRLQRINEFDETAKSKNKEKTRVCLKCGDEKPLQAFSIETSGYMRSVCAVCRRAYSKTEKAKARAKRYAASHREQIYKNSKAWRDKNKESERVRRQTYYLANKEKIQAQQNEYARNRRAQQPPKKIGRPRKKIIQITGEELIFLRFLCEDLPYSTIGKRLKMSLRSVIEMRDFFFEKFDERTRIGLILWCFRNKVIKVSRISPKGRQKWILIAAEAI